MKIDKELDILWYRAMHDSIRAGEDFARYRFAALLREKMISEGWRQCAQGQKTTQHCAVAEQARQEEREACAKVCEQSDEDGEGPDCWGWHSKDYAAAIRARSKT